MLEASLVAVGTVLRLETDVCVANRRTEMNNQCVRRPRPPLNRFHPCLVRTVQGSLVQVEDRETHQVAQLARNCPCQVCTPPPATAKSPTNNIVRKTNKRNVAPIGVRQSRDTSQREHNGIIGCCMPGVGRFFFADGNMLRSSSMFSGALGVRELIM